MNRRNGTCRSFEYSGYEIGDVRWNVKGYWEMWCNYPYMQENTKIAKFMSGDGAHWTIENGDEIGSYNFIHNIGVSGDSLGWISNGRYLISFSGPHISDDAKVSLKADRDVLKKHNYSIDKQNSVNPLIGEWAMWQQHVGSGIDSRTISYDKNGFTFPPVYKTSNVDYFTGDYDGDGVADLGVVNRDRNTWYVARVSLIGHATMMLDLEDLLHRKVDLVKEGTLLPFAVGTANRDKILIYERHNSA